MADKVPLIMPPALDKSTFFQHESLRSLWFQARRAIQQARRIICIGYSLPSSDLTMAQFLKSSAPPNRIPFEIINIKAGLETHFVQLVGIGYEFRQNEANIDSVPRFVVTDCIPNQEDKVYVSRMTHWKERLSVVVGGLSS